MNKNINLIVNVVLALAIIALFVLYFTQKPATTEIKQEVKAELSQDSTPKSVKVAYVNMDTLFEHYEFYQELDSLIRKKQSDLENNLSRDAAALEKEYMEFMEKAQKGLITRRQAQEKEQALVSKQQRLQQRQMNLQNTFMEDREEMNEQLYDSIQSFLDDYNKTQKYDLILSSALGTTLLYGKEDLDITQTVLRGLNKRYKGEE